MKRNPVVFLFSLCPLIPAASRLAYGLILGIALLWYFLSGLIFREMIRKMQPGDSGPFLELICLAGSATLYQTALQFLFPVLSVSLFLYVYLSALSYLLLLSIDSFPVPAGQFIPVVAFVPLLILFSAFREFMGSGTISLPVPGGLHEILVFPGFSDWGLAFWGTAGGALILLGIMAAIAKLVRRRLAGFRRNA